MPPFGFIAGCPRTMYTALYGRLSPYPQPDPPVWDAYNLFEVRSAQLGFLTEAAGPQDAGLWGMNDAAAGDDLAHEQADHGQVAYWQVVLTAPGVPVQQFLVVIGDAVTRLGQLDLHAVQVLLPARELAADARPVSCIGPEWFSGLSPGKRVAVRVTLDAGPDERIGSMSPVFMDAFKRQQVFMAEAPTDDHFVLLPIPFESPYADVAHHRLTFTGRLAEWSLDALAFLAAFANDLVASQGIDAPVMFMVGRS